MKRALVLTNEAARHPFRQSLPRPRIEHRSRRGLHLLGMGFAALLTLSATIASRFA